MGKFKKIKSFVSPERFKPRQRGRKIIAKANRKGRKAASLVGVFKRVAPAKKRESENGQRSAEEFLFG